MNMQALIAFDKPLTCVGNLLLQSLRDQIVVLSLSPNPDWNNVRKLIGEYLFTMQMFYSNTNWVETYGNVTCNELGELSQQSSRLVNFRKALMSYELFLATQHMKQIIPWLLW